MRNRPNTTGVRRLVRLGASSVAALSWVGLAGCTPLVPRTFVVNSTSDAVDANPGDDVCETTTLGQCTLRAAVMEANAGGLGFDNTIMLASATTYPFALWGADDAAAVGDLDVRANVILVGNGSTVSATTSPNNSRLVEHHEGTLTIRDLTLSGGLSSSLLFADGLSVGGAILNRATLHLDGVTIAASRAESGGGAIHQIGSSAQTTVTRSTITNSQSGIVSSDGAAVWIESGSILIRQSVLTANAPGDRYSTGRSVIHIQSGAIAVIDRSTISGNRNAFWACGAAGCFFAQPTSIAVDGAGTAFVARSTIVDNGPSVGGTISAVLWGSVLETCTLPATSHGYNIDADGSCHGSAAIGDVSLASPAALFGALGLHGGSTRSRVPLAGSLPVDTIPSGTALLCDGQLPTDQRGLAAPASPGTNCDIGAVERQPTDP